MSASLRTPALVLVDLDGTLVDTLPDIAFCIDRMLTEMSMAGAGPERVRDWIGDGTEMLVRRALLDSRSGQIHEAEYERALSRFSELYAAHVCDRSRVYEGVPAGLDYLHSHKTPLACITNKAEAFTSRLLAGLGLEPHFDLVVSGDTLARRKPDPMPLLHAMNQFDAKKERTLFIGDSANDVKAARAAEIGIVCVTYGYNHGRDIRDSAPDAVIDSLIELPELFATRRQNVSSESTIEAVSKFPGATRNRVEPN